nr:PREDICTED: uncharacterized protein LOC107076539 isoform X1 [Lepisosteus oculatus]XP_015195825.1 PREDICTED: uncharacterized protein LOC107076539 isoform X1 [Lepisosteus oculatus]
MARGISQDDWCQALSSIIEELTEPQYKKMMMLLPKIPQSKKKMAREEMPEVIVSQYGLEESVVAVQEAVGKIPRNDPRMIGLLQPFTAALHGAQKRPPAESHSALPEKVSKTDDSIGLQSSNTEGCYIDKDDVYDIDGAREAFILCQKENRRGAEVDLERTRKLLSKYGFKCTEETDLLGKVNQKMVQPDYTLKSSTAKVTVNVETNFTKALFLR